MKNVLLLRTLLTLAFVGLILVMYSCSGENQQKSEKIDQEVVTVIKTEEANKVDVNKLIGAWKDTSEAGLDILLLKDGSAKSLNSETLIYTKWKLKGNLLTLTSKSLGNGMSFSDDETYVIVQLDEKTLVLKTGDYLVKYIRKDGC